MNSPTPVICRLRAVWLPVVCAILGWVMLTGSAQAQAVSQSAAFSNTAPGPGISLRYGVNPSGDYQRLRLAYETSSLWNYRFGGNQRLDLSVEFGASYWWARSRSPKDLGQVFVLPILRWWPADYFYVEIGSGPSFLSHTHFAGKNFSTSFQFESHLGAGFVIGKNHHLGIAYSHASNASIKQPNPGLDVIEASYSYRF